MDTQLFARQAAEDSQSQLSNKHDELHGAASRLLRCVAVSQYLVTEFFLNT